MKTSFARCRFWAPRVLGLLFAGFIALFALDAFEAGRPAGDNLRAFVLHLAPAAGLLGLLALAWRWPWVGTVGFGALGAAYLLAFQGRFGWATYAIIAGPLLVISALFLLDWLARRRPFRGPRGGG